VKRQVDGAKELGEPFGPRPCIGHATRVAAGRSIVNPDGSAGTGQGWPHAILMATGGLTAEPAIRAG
jgi:hypothetical protein